MSETTQLTAEQKAMKKVLKWYIAEMDKQFIGEAIPIIRKTLLKEFFQRVEQFVEESEDGEVILDFNNRQKAVQFVEPYVQRFMGKYLNSLC
jgi:ABC-type transport system involved in cytochrome bd biosynthesis fused ATPase/permease subunit